VPDFSKVWEIGNAENTFSPDTVRINVGETINFTISQYHNAVQVIDRT
jgi:plastocyanin